MNKLAKIIIALVMWLAPAPGQAEEASAPARPEVFAIAADQDQATAEIAKLPGVAPFFHIYDESGKLIEVVANPFLDRDYGIGPAAANMLADKGVTVLIGRNRPGPVMMEVLDKRQIRMVRRIGTVADVVKELKE